MYFIISVNIKRQFNKRICCNWCTSDLLIP